MSNAELTPWFVNGEKPAYPGVYNVSCQKVGQSGKWWAYWCGSQWFAFSWSKEWTLDYFRMHRTRRSMDGCSWRGLARNPEGVQP